MPSTRTPEPATSRDPADRWVPEPSPLCPALPHYASLLLAAVALIAVLPMSSARALPTFDGRRAWERVETQCAFGPRVPGTSGHARCRDWIVGQLAATGLAVERFDFQVPAPATGEPMDLTNLLVRIAPELEPRLLLGAHWDTRPWSDQEKDPARRALPVPGANDGGSGVAVLLGLADLLARDRPPIGVDLVFFDGEDQGRSGSPWEYSLGSQWMAGHWPEPWPNYVLVLDMVGAEATDLGRDLVSLEQFPEWNDLIFGVAEARGYTEFNRERRYNVFDDHIPFLQRGIPAAVVIGFDDPNWHTQGDVPAAVNAERLRRVGEVVLEIVYGSYLGAGQPIGR